MKLHEQGRDRTRLTLEHTAHSDEAKWKQYGPGAVGVGWDMALMGLYLHMKTKAPVDAKAVEAWTTSDDGKSFMRVSSDGWCAATIANGEDPRAARNAAARTFAAYTGAPEPADA